MGVEAAPRTMKMAARRLKATSDPSTSSAMADFGRDDSGWGRLTCGRVEFSGQSGMEKGSTRIHENATADPSLFQDDSSGEETS